MVKIIHKDLSHKINGLCFQAQKELGRFCREKQYVDRLVELLNKEKMIYKREYEIKKLVSTSPNGNRVDLLIEGKIILDAKAKNFITKDDYYQRQRYLRGADLKLGLIVNFRDSHLKPKRVINSDAEPRMQSNSKNDINKDSQHSHVDSYNSHRQSGFTLIETLIYMAIISIVVTSLVFFSISISNSNVKVYVIQEVQANARTAIDIISQKIRLAEDVINPSEGEISNVLVLDMPNSSSNLTFESVSGVLSIGETGTGTTTITSDEVNISNLEFTNLAAPDEKDNIRIEMGIEYNNTGSDIIHTYEQEIKTSVSLRQ
ncbi:MAG: GxxExxY protein [Patescibacteria group bacterium]